MTTTAGQLHSTHPPRPAIAAAIGALLLAMALSFLAGRATARQLPARAPGLPPAASTAAPAEPQPWATHGFRDDETAQDGCVTTDCTG